MSDDALIRLSNLKSLDLTPAQLSEKVGGRYTYWRDLLAGQKSFGEKIARKIEEGLELPRGHLDSADEQTADARWPFTQEGVAQFQRLTPEQLASVKEFTEWKLSQVKAPPDTQTLPTDTISRTSPTKLDWEVPQSEVKKEHEQRGPDKAPSTQRGSR